MRLGKRRTSRGFAFVVLLAFMTVGALYLFVSQLDAAAIQRRRDEVTTRALTEAKSALIGEAVAKPQIAELGRLPLPDIGQSFGKQTEGYAAGDFTASHKDYSVVGKLPWHSLGTAPLRDGIGECLWYMVSGRFKGTPPTAALNWDTPGQIDIVDSAGNSIASNLVALVVAPGAALDGQSRALNNAAYKQCGGNYDARNYLDAYDAADAIAAEVNYFTGSINNRVAGSTSNKRFVVANTSHYNDRVIAIASDEIFRIIGRRGDFAAAIANWLDNSTFSQHLRDVAIAGRKGTDNVDCKQAAASDQAFCKNWKEMLLLTDLPGPSTITLDGASLPNCSRIVIFGGQRVAGQARTTETDKSNPANYLEGSNNSAFRTPTASDANFTIWSQFDANVPSRDVGRCL